MSIKTKKCKICKLHESSFNDNHRKYIFQQIMIDNGTDSRPNLQVYLL